MTDKDVLSNLVFDLSRVTTADVVAISENMDMRTAMEYLDKITPGIEVLELPFNLIPVVLARYGTYIESCMNPNNIIDQLRDFLGEDDDE